MTNSDFSAYFVQFIKSLFCNFNNFDVMGHRSLAGTATMKRVELIIFAIL
jgi:hypothetical protein